jgi:flagellum-specific peptidoglycan hydrolase FlgJ
MDENKFDELIYLTAKRAGYNHLSAKLIVAQARLESADYTSNVFRTNLNTSGIKYVGQPLAKKGSLVPLNERTTDCKNNNNCSNINYYAKFDSVQDSAKDKIERIFATTMNGVTTQELKNAKNELEFARLLKKRNYFGADTNQYASFLESKMKRINHLDSMKDSKTETTTQDRTAMIVVLLIIVGIAYYKRDLLKKLIS